METPQEFAKRKGFTADPPGVTSYHIMFMMMRMYARYYHEQQVNSVDLGDVSGMSFCDKAERFVAWLDQENLASFWHDGNMIYYCIRGDGEDIPAEMVLKMFEEEQKDLR